MATLTAAERNQMSATAFALRGRRYPIENASHAQNALARVSQYGTPDEKVQVRTAVHAKYPSMGQQPE